MARSLNTWKLQPREQIGSLMPSSSISVASSPVAGARYVSEHSAIEGSYVLFRNGQEPSIAIAPEDSQLDDAQLRNLARELLLGIAADMRGTQTDAQQEAKAHGDRPGLNSAFNRIGRGHADDRLAQGFGINELVAEYRALRASVLRRWQQTCEIDPATFQETIRFNEAIDQMVAESVRQFAQSSERIRDLFAGVLAHDMRSPLGAILNSAYVVLRDENLSPTSLCATAVLYHGAEQLKMLRPVSMPCWAAGHLPIQLDGTRRHDTANLLEQCVPALLHQEPVHAGRLPAHPTMGARSRTRSDTAPVRSPTRCDDSTTPYGRAHVRHAQALDGLDALPNA